MVFGFTENSPLRVDMPVYAVSAETHMRVTLGKVRSRKPSTRHWRVRARARGFTWSTRARSRRGSQAAEQAATTWSYGLYSPQGTTMLSTFPAVRNKGSRPGREGRLGYWYYGRLALY